jgi:hypothetical protein
MIDLDDVRNLAVPLSSMIERYLLGGPHYGVEEMHSNSTHQMNSLDPVSACTSSHTDIRHSDILLCPVA